VSEPFFERTRRLLVLIPAAWKARDRGGLSLADAARLTGARSTKVVEDDVLSMHGLSLAPSFPEHEVMLELANGRIHAALTAQLVEPPALSLREGAALLAALRPFEQDGGATVKAAARKLRHGIPVYLRPRADELARATDFQIDAPGEWASSFEEAIDRRVEVTIEYRASATADATRKVLEPRLLFPQEGHWYLAAWNVERKEEHLYRLDRIVSVVLGTRVFGAHQGPRVDRYATKQLYFQSGQEREVQVRFRSIAAKVAEERWPSQCEVQADGSVVVTAHLTPGPYLYAWVLGFGGDAEVVGPEDVRSSFQEHVETLRRTYAGPESARVGT
jgi:proteasome accessory factor C